MPGILQRARARFRGARARWPVLDHAVRTVERAQASLWGRLAASVTYFAFLSFFPLLALGFSFLGYLTVVSPDIRDQVEEAVAAAFPGLIGDGPRQIDVDDLAAARGQAGLLGLAGLVWAGTAAVDALRDAIRVVFGSVHIDTALPVRKLRDLVVLLVLGFLVLASVAATSITTQLTSALLDAMGLGDSRLAPLALRSGTIAVAVVVNTCFLAFAFRFLSGIAPRWRDVRNGAILGAVGLELLKLSATFLLGNAFDNPLYAGFTVVVGLLLWIHFSARIVVLAAAWAATEPRLRDRPPQLSALE